MTVSDLMAILAKHPPEREVMLDDHDTNWLLPLRLCEPEPGPGDAGPLCFTSRYSDHGK